MKFFKSYFLIQIVPNVTRVCYGHRMTGRLRSPAVLTTQLQSDHVVQNHASRGNKQIFNLLVALLEGDSGCEEWIASNAFTVHTASTMNAVGSVELRKCAVKLCFFWTFTELCSELRFELGVKHVMKPMFVQWSSLELPFPAILYDPASFALQIPVLAMASCPSCPSAWGIVSSWREDSEGNQFFF